MIRVVPTGDLGLDVLLGGGWRLVKRFEDRESATVVVRGGSGAGKTLMGIQVALELAKALGGDVAVGCVEILPTEYVAQLQSARPSLAAERVAMLPASPAADANGGPRVFVSLLNNLDSQSPDLVTALEDLDARVKAAGGKPAAFIVDSLIEGYGLGADTPRIDADDILKFAARYGHALVLCEEVASDQDSPWVFAADTVLQLGVESRERGRWIEARKHRFGPSATGRHELELASRPAVFPAPTAWPRASFSSLNIPIMPAAEGFQAELRWPGAPPIKGMFISVSSETPQLAVRMAASLAPTMRPAPRQLIIYLDPMSAVTAASSRTLTVIVPTHAGPARALRAMIEHLISHVTSDGQLSVDMVLVGDLRSVDISSDDSDWLNALRTVAMLLMRLSTPLVTFFTTSQYSVQRLRLDEELARYADSSVFLAGIGPPLDPRAVRAMISNGLPGTYVDIEVPLSRAAE